MKITNKIIILVVAVVFVALPVDAEGFFSNVGMRSRLGYNIGGTAPVGMPAEIRKLNSYKLQFNTNIGFDLLKPVASNWSVMAGVHFDRKAMKEDANVKNYHEQIVRGGESLEGRFTGDVTTKAVMDVVSIPIQAVYSPLENLDIRFGPYFSYVYSREFSGYAHNGYLRVGNPTGAKVMLGDDPDTRGEYDFSDDMRRQQWGLDLGADWFVSRHFGIYADLQWGLSGTFKSSFHVMEQTLYPIYGTIGVVWKMRK